MTMGSSNGMSIFGNVEQQNFNVLHDPKKETVLSIERGSRNPVGRKIRSDRFAYRNDPYRGDSLLSFSFLISLLKVSNLINSHQKGISYILRSSLIVE